MDCASGVSVFETRSPILNSDCEDNKEWIATRDAPETLQAVTRPKTLSLETETFTNQSETRPRSRLPKRDQDPIFRDETLSRSWNSRETEMSLVQMMTSQIIQQHNSGVYKQSWCENEGLRHAHLSAIFMFTFSQLPFVHILGRVHRQPKKFPASVHVECNYIN